MVDPAVKLDGGDVLFTGREILVGLSSRTNKAGVEAVQAAFPGFPVTGIEVAGPLHLKTLLTLCGEDTLCASIESGDSFTMLKVSLRSAFVICHDSVCCVCVVVCVCVCVCVCVIEIERERERRSRE